MSPVRACLRMLVATAMLVAALGAMAEDDPAVYITAADTERFSPAAALSVTDEPGRWFQRRVGFAARGDTILMAHPGTLYPDLTVEPRLRGEYNLYVNMREVNAQTGVQIKLSGRDLAWTITPGLGTAEVHTNRDILVAVGLEMTSQTLLIRSIGRLVYVSYLKLVPTAADGSGLKIDPERVREEPLSSPADEWVATQDLVPEGMAEQKHIPDVPETPAEDDGRGYVLYTRPYLDLIFPDTVPAAREVCSELRISAARGEHEPAVFSVYATRDLGPLTVAVEDLTDGARRIDKSAVSIATVACRNLRTSFAGKVYMHAPALLDPTLPVNVPAGTSRQVWLTVRVPSEAAAGTYRTTITIRPTQGQATDLGLTVRVYPFVLPEPRDVSLGMYDRVTALRPGTDWLREHCADLRAHGMTSIGYCGGLSGQIVTSEGAAGVQFDGMCGFEQIMDAYRDAGFPQPLLWLMDGDIWAWCAGQATPGSAEFETLYRQVIGSILEQVKARHWPGIVFQPVDEPGSYGERPKTALIERWATESRLIKEAGGLVEVDHIPFSTTDERLKGALERALPFIDIFTQRYTTGPVWFEPDGWEWKSLKQQAREWGKQFWSYNINNANFFPELATMRLAYGYFIWLQDVDGQMTWAYQTVSGNPLNALDGSSTDMMYTYPAIPEAGVPGGPSLMWECIREGVDDLRYIQLLETLIDRAEARGQAKRVLAARELLQQLRSSFDWERLESTNRFIECRWDETLTMPSGQQTAAGRFNVPNGWGPGDYDRWRRAIGAQIMALGADQ